MGFVLLAAAVVTVSSVIVLASGRTTRGVDEVAETDRTRFRNTAVAGIITGIAVAVAAWASSSSTTFRRARPTDSGVPVTRHGPGSFASGDRGVHLRSQEPGDQRATGMRPGERRVGRVVEGCSLLVDRRAGSRDHRVASRRTTARDLVRRPRRAEEADPDLGQDHRRDNGRRRGRALVEDLGEGTGPREVRQPTMRGNASSKKAPTEMPGSGSSARRGRAPSSKSRMGIRTGASLAGRCGRPTSNGS